MFCLSRGQYRCTVTSRRRWSGGKRTKRQHQFGYPEINISQAKLAGWRMEAAAGIYLRTGRSGDGPREQKQQVSKRLRSLACCGRRRQTGDSTMVRVEAGSIRGSGNASQAQKGGREDSRSRAFWLMKRLKSSCVLTSYRRWAKRKSIQAVWRAKGGVELAGSFLHEGGGGSKAAGRGRKELLTFGVGVISFTAPEESASGGLRGLGSRSEQVQASDWPSASLFTGCLVCASVPIGFRLVIASEIQAPTKQLNT